MSEALEWKIEQNNVLTFLVGALVLVAVGEASLLAAIHLGAVFLGAFGFVAVVFAVVMTAYGVARHQNGYCRAFLGRFVDWDTPSIEEWRDDLEARNAFEGGDA